MEYGCGGIGASGVGTVFYANSTAFPCGAEMTSMCNYLEVAPNGWNGDKATCIGGCGGSDDQTSDWGTAGPGTGKGYLWCGSSGDVQTGTVVGSGLANTSAMLTMCDSGAANQARGYPGGGMTDWSLPAQDELNALYYYPNRNPIGGFAASNYWSSSQPSSDGAWDQDFSKGNQYTASPRETYGVRPVRSF